MVNLILPFHPMKFAHTTWHMHTYGGKIILISEWEPRKSHLNRPGSCEPIIHRSSFASIFLLMRRKLHCELTQFLEALSIQSLCLQEMKEKMINRWLSPKTSILCFFVWNYVSVGYDFNSPWKETQDVCLRHQNVDPISYLGVTYNLSLLWHFTYVMAMVRS